MEALGMDSIPTIDALAVASLVPALSFRNATGKLRRSNSLPSGESTSADAGKSASLPKQPHRSATFEHEVFPSPEAQTAPPVGEIQCSTEQRSNIGSRSLRVVRMLARRKTTHAVMMEENYDLMMERFQLRKLSRRPSRESSRTSDRVLPIADMHHLPEHKGAVLDTMDNAQKPADLHRLSSWSSLSSIESGTSHHKTKKQANAPRFSWKRNAKANWKAFKHALVTPLAPDGLLFQTSQTMLRIVLVMQMVYAPFQLAFLTAVEDKSTLLNMAFEIMLLVDFILHFNTGYYDKKKVLVTSRRAIAWRYAKSWLLVDLLSSIPVDTIMFFQYHRTDHASTASFGGVAHFLFDIWMRVPRLFHAIRIKQMISTLRMFRSGRDLWKWLRFSRYSHLFRIVYLIAMVLLVTHYIACFWELVNPNHAVLTSIGTTEATASTKLRHVSIEYVQTFYDAIQLVQGQSVSANTMAQQIYASVAALIGSLVLAIVYGNVAMLVSNFSANATNYQRKMESVFATMKKMQLPRDLQERIHEYYDHLWEEYDALDGDIVKFSHELSHTLALEVGLYKYMKVVMESSFWKHCSADFVAKIVLHLVVRVYLPDDYVVRQGEVGDQMFMINRGVCELTSVAEAAKEAPGHDLNVQQLISPRLLRTASNRSLDKYADKDDPMETTMAPTKRKHVNIVKLQSAQAFGELALIMNYKETTNVRAISHVEMCVLSRNDFQMLLTRYRDDRKPILTSILRHAVQKSSIRRLPSPLRERMEALEATIVHANEQDGAAFVFMTKQQIVEKMVVDRLVNDLTVLSGKDESIVFGIHRGGSSRCTDQPSPPQDRSCCCRCQESIEPSAMTPEPAPAADRSLRPKAERKPRVTEPNADEKVHPLHHRRVPLAPVRTHKQPSKPDESSVKESTTTTTEKPSSTAQSSVTISELTKRVGRLEKVERANHKLLVDVSLASDELRERLDEIAATLRSRTANSRLDRSMASFTYPKANDPPKEEDVLTKRTKLATASTDYDQAIVRRRWTTHRSQSLRQSIGIRRLSSPIGPRRRSSSQYLQRHLSNSVTDATSTSSFTRTSSHLTEAVRADGTDATATTTAPTAAESSSLPRSRSRHRSNSLVGKLLNFKM